MIDEWSDMTWVRVWWKGMNGKCMRADGCRKDEWSDSDGWGWIVNEWMNGIVHTSTITNSMIKRVWMEWTIEWNRSDIDMNGMKMSDDRIEW